jgi:hypothetical protein
MAKPLKCHCCSFSTFCVIASHQTLMDDESCTCWIVLVSKCSQASGWCQTSFAKGQCRHRCRPVSNGLLYKTQQVLARPSLEAKISVVRIVLCMIVQANNLHLFLCELFKLHLACIFYMSLGIEPETLNTWNIVHLASISRLWSL